MDNITAVNMLKMRNLGLSIPDDVYDFIINSLEELEQYREFGTIEKFMMLSEQFNPHKIDDTSCQQRNCNKCDKYRKENEEYHKIGTAEECWEARERQKEKKPNLVIPCKSVNYYQCPVCGELVSMNENFCNNCGQALYWEE